MSQMPPPALTAARETLGLSRKQLGDVLGVSRQCVYYWEAGLRVIPPIVPLAIEAYAARVRVLLDTPCK